MSVASDIPYQTESLEVDLLLEGVVQKYGYDFRGYARTSLMRRIRHAVRREGLATISALQSRILHDPHAMARFVEGLSVHTTAMFRDHDVYQALRGEIIPLLRTYPFIRIWHAGCSSGEEVYSLAILLHEAGIYDRCRLYATDLSDRLIERGRNGIYPLAAMRDHTLAYRKAGGREDFSAYYDTDVQYAVIRRWLRQNTVFSQHNLVSDDAFNEFHLILCRNVMIYFDKPLRERVHDLLYRSLAKFGVLSLGKKESLHHTPYQDRFQELWPDLRIYRRIR